MYVTTLSSGEIWWLVTSKNRQLLKFKVTCTVLSSGRLSFAQQISFYHRAKFIFFCTCVKIIMMLILVPWVLVTSISGTLFSLTTQKLGPFFLITAVHVTLQKRTFFNISKYFLREKVLYSSACWQKKLSEGT